MRPVEQLLRPCRARWAPSGAEVRRAPRPTPPLGSGGPGALVKKVWPICRTARSAFQAQEKKAVVGSRSPGVRRRPRPRLCAPSVGMVVASMLDDTIEPSSSSARPQTSPAFADARMGAWQLKTMGLTAFGGFRGYKQHRPATSLEPAPPIGAVDRWRLRRRWRMEMMEKARASCSQTDHGTPTSKVDGRARVDGRDVLAVLHRVQSPSSSE